MYINGFYVNYSSHLINRSNNYKGIDLIITNQSSKDLTQYIQEDYLNKGSNGFNVWSNIWPKELHIMSSETRIDYYKELDINPISKELLYFRNIDLGSYKGLLLINTLNTYMSPSNIQYVLKCLLNKASKELQVLILLEICIYNDYKFSSNIDSQLGFLLVQT